jgi:hypothetical protein
MNPAGLTIICLGALLAVPARAQTKSDSASIRAAALDYIDGWYAGDGARMARAVHPELAKRIVRTGADGVSKLEQMSAMTLVDRTAAGGGTRTPESRRQHDVAILDIFENVASVKVVAADWIDYLHLARYNGAWRIVNVLWELKPAAPAGPPR